MSLELSALCCYVAGSLLFLAGSVLLIIKHFS
jgi:hypothetical protein